MSGHVGEECELLDWSGGMDYSTGVQLADTFDDCRRETFEWGLGGLALNKIKKRCQLLHI